MADALEKVLKDMGIKRLSRLHDAQNKIRQLYNFPTYALDEIEGSINKNDTMLQQILNNEDKTRLAFYYQELMLDRIRLEAKYKRVGKKKPHQREKKKAIKLIQCIDAIIEKMKQHTKIDQEIEVATPDYLFLVPRTKRTYV